MLPFLLVFPMSYFARISVLGPDGKEFRDTLDQRQDQCLYPCDSH
jgi:hypothetical protein